MKKAWAKISIGKREVRRTFSRRHNHGETSEYVIKVKGFSGELRKIMTDKEATEWVKNSNKDAFLSAAKASKDGLHGFERFSKDGEVALGMRNVMMRTAGRSLFKPRKERSNDTGSNRD